MDFTLLQNQDGVGGKGKITEIEEVTRKKVRGDQNLEEKGK